MHTPSRRAGRLRSLAAPCAARHARGHRGGLAAAGLHLRPGRPADLPDVGRRLGLLPDAPLHARSRWCAPSTRSARPSATPRRPSTGRWRRSRASMGVRKLRISVSAGEGLPDATRQLWKQASGIEMLDGIGATEMFHIFISSAGDEVRRGAIGKVVPGYAAQGGGRRRQRSAARHRRQAGGDRADRLQVPGRRAPGELREGRLELSGRRLRAGRRRLLLLPGPRRRHDHHRRLQRGRARRSRMRCCGIRRWPSAA